MSDIPRRGRGRPALVHDNIQVSDFLSGYNTSGGAAKAMPQIGDVFAGCVVLQTEGQDSTRSLSKRRLFRALRECKAISTVAVAEAIGRGYSRSQVARYVAAARVASKAIAPLLEAQKALSEQDDGWSDDLEAEVLGWA